MLILLGMNEYDRERAKHQAKKNAENMYDEHYVCPNVSLYSNMASY